MFKDLTDVDYRRFVETVRGGHTNTINMALGKIPIGKMN
jgi:hypothetical protein